MLKVTLMVSLMLSLLACSSTPKQQSIATSNQVEAETNANTNKPKQVCRMEKAIGTNMKTKVCHTK